MLTPTHARVDEPSAWIMRFAALLERGKRVLDLACGSGRHARALAARGIEVEAVDRDTGALASLAGVAGVTTLQADLEGQPWPFAGRRFDAIVVANYLHRPLFAPIVAALEEDGVLIYETFMAGNERFGKPSNPDFLLRPGELLEWLGRDCRVLAFEQGEVSVPRPAAVQRVCARRGAGRLRLP